MKKAVLVSKCLLGEKCRWDGKTLKAIDLTASAGCRIIPICPEMDGGLPCPRPSAEIVKGDGFSVLDGKSSVIDAEGRDVTDNYLKGAQAALNKALVEMAEVAYLKDGSPSCGARTIRGNRQKIAGLGVAAALLKRHGIKLESIE